MRVVLKVCILALGTMFLAQSAHAGISDKVSSALNSARTSISSARASVGNYITSSSAYNRASSAVASARSSFASHASASRAYFSGKYESAKNYISTHRGAMAAAVGALPVMGPGTAAIAAIRNAPQAVSQVKDSAHNLYNRASSAYVSAKSSVRESVGNAYSRVKSFAAAHPVAAAALAGGPALGPAAAAVAAVKTNPGVVNRIKDGARNFYNRAVSASAAAKSSIRESVSSAYTNFSTHSARTVMADIGDRVVAGIESRRAVLANAIQSLGGKAPGVMGDKAGNFVARRANSVSEAVRPGPAMKLMSTPLYAQSGIRTDGPTGIK